MSDREAAREILRLCSWGRINPEQGILALEQQSEQRLRLINLLKGGFPFSEAFDRSMRKEQTCES